MILSKKRLPAHGTLAVSFFVTGESAFEAAGCDTFNKEALEGKEDDENRNDGKNTGCHDQSVLSGVDACEHLDTGYADARVHCGVRVAFLPCVHKDAGNKQ